MKAKELAEKLLENPEAIVCVWDGEPNDTWVEINTISYVENGYIEMDVDGYKKSFQKADKSILLGFKK